MKSIKEKAEDYVYGFHQSIQIMCKESFEDGANYVLEQVENIIVNNEDNTLNMARCLIECIKQLKNSYDNES